MSHLDKIKEAIITCWGKHKVPYYFDEENYNIIHLGVFSGYEEYHYKIDMSVSIAIHDDCYTVISRVLSTFDEKYKNEVAKLLSTINIFCPYGKFVLDYSCENTVSYILSMNCLDYIPIESAIEDSIVSGLACWSILGDVIIDVMLGKKTAEEGCEDCIKILGSEQI